MITLYKGDDTGGQLGKNVKIVFHCDDGVDMSDVTVKFDLLGIVKREFTDVHDGDILDIFISHAESRKFPLGVIFAKIWGEDSSGKIRTFANRIPFRVTLNLIAVYGSDGTDSQDIHVYSSVDWDSIANKPTVFPSSVDEVEGLQEALDDINGKIPEDASADNQLADKEWVDQEIDRVAAYYITSDAQGNPFPTQAALLNAETYYSGGSPRTPTRNDYAIVLSDETHDDTEWRYIYSVNEQGVGTWEAQYPVEGAIVADDNVTKTGTNPVKSSGIWAAIWGALAAIPAGFSSMYDWVVAQLGQKRNYTDLSYNTQVIVNAPALHAILTSRGSQVLEYYLPCTEDIPATPAINHVYTWRKDGAEFYITQGVSVYSTIWILFGSGGEQLATTTTDNANDGWFPDLTFVVSANSEVTTTKSNSYPAEIHDTLALNSEIPTSLPWSAITGKPQSYTPSAHASTHAANGSDPITPSSIGALGNSGTQRITNGSLKVVGGNISLDGTHKFMLDEGVGIGLVLDGNRVVGISFGDGAAKNVVLPLDGEDTIAFLANIYAAIQQIAPAFDARTYQANDLCSYNGVIYRCKLGYTSTASSPKPDADTTHWEAKKVSELFLPLTGGTVTGDLEVVYASSGFTVKNTSGDYLQIRHDTVAGDFWYITYSVNNVGSGSLRLPHNNIIPADVYSLAELFNTGTTYALNSLCVDSQGVLYRCVNPNGHTGAWVAADFAEATVEDVLAALRTAIAGKAEASDLRYTLPETATTISSASSEVVSGETVYYGEATLADRTQNQVAVLVALDELRVTIPPAVSGKVRDFGLVVLVGLGEGTALAAPALVPVAPTGETITMMNAEGEMPTLADGTTTSMGLTVLYFTELGNGTFLVKGEQIQEVA